MNYYFRFEDTKRFEFYFYEKVTLKTTRKFMKRKIYVFNQNLPESTNKNSFTLVTSLRQQTSTIANITYPVNRASAIYFPA